MSRDAYGGGGGSGGGVGASGRSPRPPRRDLSADPYFQEGPRAHSPGAAARRSRSATRAVSPSMALDPHSSSYMEPHGGMDPDRRSGSAPGTHHRSRSQSRSNPARNYHAMDRDPHDREFMPIRDSRDRSMERGGLGGAGGAMDLHGGNLPRRERSLDRGAMMEDDLYRDHHGMGGGRTRTSPNHGGFGGPNMGRELNRDPYLMEMQVQNLDMQKELGNLKKELELTNQKLGSSMHSIKTFWSPELKKERALRKEESAKYSLINDQLKLFNSENQKQALLVRQLEEELRLGKSRGPSAEIQSQIDSLVTENEHLMRESNILRETIKELELRIVTQKQTLSDRDESIKKILEMLQQKGIGKEEERAMVQQMQAVFQKQLEEARQEIQRRDQDILAMSAKMKTLEEQHRDYTRHIMVLKESLMAKEGHYNMLQADVEELRQRLEEKNKTIEKKTQQALQATQERNRLNNEATELRDHMDIKDRKISVLQRKLDLHEANQQLQAGGQANEEIQHIKKQMEEQMRSMDQKSRNLESRNKQLDEREKTLLDLEARLQTKKEQLDNLEIQMSRSASTEAIPASEANHQLNEMRKALGNQEKQLETLLKEKKSAVGAMTAAQSETERLLQVMQMSQEEQFSKDKTIKELQDMLKAERIQRGAPAGPIPGSGIPGPPTVQQPQQLAVSPTPSHSQGPSPSPGAGPVPGPGQKQEQPPRAQGPTQSVLDGIAAPLSGTAAANLAGAAGKASASAQEAAKATLEQAKNVAQAERSSSSTFCDHYGSLDEISSESEPTKINFTSRTHNRSHSQPDLNHSEILMLEIEGKEREIRLHVDQLEVDLKLKDSLIENLTDEGKKYQKRIEQLEEDLKKCDKLEELDDLVKIARQKNERIEELEEALRESVRIATDMEMEKKDEEERRKEITEKLEELEDRLEKAQNSHSLKCASCRYLREELKNVEQQLNTVVSERKKHLDQLLDMKHEALTAALSEKDAHLALLELGAIRSPYHAQEIASLVADRTKLNNRIKKQSEERVRLMQEFAVPQINIVPVSPPSSSHAAIEANKRNAPPVDSGKKNSSSYH